MFCLNVWLTEEPDKVMKDGEIIVHEAVVVEKSNKKLNCESVWL